MNYLSTSQAWEPINYIMATGIVIMVAALAYWFIKGGVLKNFLNHK